MKSGAHWGIFITPMGWTLVRRVSEFAMNSFQIPIISAVFAVALAIFVDVAGHAPAFSLLLGICGGVVLLWRIVRAKSGERVSSALLRPSAIHVLVLAFPICIVSGLACQSLAMNEAEHLRQVLLTKSSTESIDKAYAEYCWNDSTRYCGFFTYKVMLASRGTLDSSYLIVMQFNDRRTSVDLVTGKRTDP